MLNINILSVINPDSTIVSKNVLELYALILVNPNPRSPDWFNPSISVSCNAKNDNVNELLEFNSWSELLNEITS